jgi:phosphoenolpyruvate carboxykinase (ATP)
VSKNRIGVQPSTYGLENHGLYHLGKEYWNLGHSALVDHAIRRGEGRLADNGALVVSTGSRTGRSPKDKFVVEEPTWANRIWWGAVNRPISEEHFNDLHHRVAGYLQGRDIYVRDCFAGTDPEYRLPIRVVNELAWHNLFGECLFVRPREEELKEHVPEYTILSAPGFHGAGASDGLNSEVFVLLNFKKKMILIGGSHYAGEMKKSIFSVLNFLLPPKGVLSMHCSANIGHDGETALFFGLSGTGKTTLSADPSRELIGDDEHGWSDRGVFNFEGGCYAKMIDLTQEREPEIWDAIRFGAVLENVVMDEDRRTVDYHDTSITENTRGAYPIDSIAHAELSGRGDHPTNIILLTCDAFGVLPPISKLTSEQAMYHFLSGYTAKVAGTEAGITEPQTTFSACFGSPFLPLHPNEYAKLLGEKILKHKVNCWLVNTGWSGGPYGVGHRMNLPDTRAMVTAALDHTLKDVETRPHPIFGVHVPTSCPGVEAKILDPRETWKDPREYDRTAKSLAEKFHANATKMGNVAPEILAAGPRV